MPRILHLYTMGSNNILIADPDESVRVILELSLEHNGCRIKAVASGEDADRPAALPPGGPRPGSGDVEGEVAQAKGSVTCRRRSPGRR